MNSPRYEYRSNLLRRYVAQGKAEGRVEIVLKQLTARFGPLSDVVQARIRGAQETQIDVLAERLLTAQTLDEALASLS